MNDRQGSLELEVSNFGPIVEARIDLRPLTVFVGPSNTGKSYLAILIYALHRYFSGGGWLGRHRAPAKFWAFRRHGNEKLPREAIKSIVELAEQMLEDEGKSAADEGIMLPASVVEIIRSGLGDQDDYIGHEISRCFGIKETGALIRKGAKGATHIVFRKRSANDSAPIGPRLIIGERATEFQPIVPEKIRMRIGVKDGDYPIEYLRFMVVAPGLTADQQEERRGSYAWTLLKALTDQVPLQIVGPLALPAYYLPADRTGIMHTHRVVVSALIGSAAMTGLRPAARTPMLSGVLADFLGQLIELDRSPRRRRRPRQDLAAQIEKAILGGSVEIDRSQAIDYPHFTYRPKGWKEDLSLTHASSMVSELAPVVLYLRHVIVPGNVLIVEEPESHLHPAMQVEFIRQLAGLVHAGVRVIVTTHSEWVLEELANIVTRSALPAGEHERVNGADVALRPDQVGAWLFKPKRRPKGSIVEEVKLDKETGLYPTDYDDVAAALHNDWADIASRIGAAE